MLQSGPLCHESPVVSSPDYSAPWWPRSQTQGTGQISLVGGSLGTRLGQIDQVRSRGAIYMRSTCMYFAICPTKDWTVARAAELVSPR